MGIVRSTARPVNTLSPLYRDLVQQQFGDVADVSAASVREKLKVLQAENASAADVLALRGLLSLHSRGG